VQEAFGGGPYGGYNATAVAALANATLAVYPPSTDAWSNLAVVAQVRASYLLVHVPVRRDDDALLGVERVCGERVAPVAWVAPELVRAARDAARDNRFSQMGSFSAAHAVLRAQWQPRAAHHLCTGSTCLSRMTSCAYVRAGVAMFMPLHMAYTQLHTAARTHAHACRYDVFGDYHSAEVMFVFGMHQATGTPQSQAIQVRLSACNVNAAAAAAVVALCVLSPAHSSGALSVRVPARVQTYWANFAKAGTPNGAGAPAVWPVYNATADEVLVFAESPTAQSGLSAAMCAFWDSEDATANHPT
jgi:carboxylesterase type B